MYILLLGVLYMYYMCTISVRLLAYKLFAFYDHVGKCVYSHGLSHGFLKAKV